jgi:hypothetical protein
VHDLALVAGAATKGHAAACSPGALCQDSTLPFSQGALAAHVARVFFAPARRPLSPPGGGGKAQGLMGAADGLFCTVEEARAWAAEAVGVGRPAAVSAAGSAPVSAEAQPPAFPMSGAELEARLEAVLEALTADLADAHPLRVRRCALSPSFHLAGAGVEAPTSPRRVPLALEAVLEESKLRRMAHYGERHVPAAPFSPVATST